MPYRYQGRTDQARSIAQARHWVERLAQLAQFESVVLHTQAQIDDARARAIVAERTAAAGREGPAV